MSVLYVVATPIGNLQDLSPRISETLKKVSLIAAEDTRVTSKLLSVLEIRVPMVSYRRENEEAIGDQIVSRMLAEDIEVAVVSDAGTPCISDPGAVLVRKAIAVGIRVVPVSGPSAVVTALSACGWELKSFSFHGFLPRKAKDQKAILEKIRLADNTAAVFYESPHRIKDLIKNLACVDPDCEIALFSDLTKYYERAYRGTCAQVLGELDANPKSEKGEYSLCVKFSPLPEETGDPDALSLDEQILISLFRGEEDDSVMRALREKGYKRGDIYNAFAGVTEFLRDMIDVIYPEQDEDTEE